MCEDNQQQQHCCLCTWYDTLLFSLAPQFVVPPSCADDHFLSLDLSLCASLSPYRTLTVNPPLPHPPTPHSTTLRSGRAASRREPEEDGDGGAASKADQGRAKEHRGTVRTYVSLNLSVRLGELILMAQTHQAP